MLLALYLLSGLSARADLKVPEHEVATPINLNRKVEWGGSLEIRLQLAVPRKQKTLIGEGPTPEFEFFIRRPPKCGQLGEVRQLPAGDGADAALVTYQNTGWPEGGIDSFEFAARGRGGVVPMSGIIEVRVIRGRLELGSTTALRLGVVPLGQSLTGDVMVRNNGSAPSNFSVRVTGTGFSLLTAGGGVLAPRSSQPITVAFNGARAGEAAGELIVQELPPSLYGASAQGVDVRRIALTAMVGSPYEVAPDHLSLRAGADSEAREASFVIRNLLREPITVELRVPDPFEAQVAGLKLLPAGSGSAGIKIKEKTPPGSYRGTIELTASGYVRRIAVEGVVPAPARLTVSGGSPVWVLAGTGAPVPTKTLNIQNAGEQPWLGTLQIDAPFRVDPAKLDLAPGTMQTLTLSVAPSLASTGIFTGNLRFQGSTNLTLPLRMEIGNAPPPPSPQPPPPPRPSSPTTPRRPVEEEAPPRTSSSQALTLPPNDFDLRGLRAEPDRPGIVQISWRPEPDDQPAQFRLLIRHLKPVPNENRVEYALTPLSDVPCKPLKNGRFAFDVDQLRPSWGYSFQVEQLSAAGSPLGLSNVVAVSTPRWPELDAGWDFPWGMTLVVLVGGGITWAGWRKLKKRP